MRIIPLGEIQTYIRKQWNLVVLNLNGLTAWITHLIRGL